MVQQVLVILTFVWYSDYVLLQSLNEMNISEGEMTLCPKIAIECIQIF